MTPKSSVSNKKNRRVKDINKNINTHEDKSNWETDNTIVLRSRRIKRNIPGGVSATTAAAAVTRHFYNTTSHRPQLPTEIIVQVLQYVTQIHDLYTCSLVNKQFFAISSPLLWKSPKLNNKGILRHFIACLTMADQPQLQESLSIGRYIRTLDLDDWFWTDTEFLQLLPHVPYLEELKIIYKRCRKRTITNASLQYLPRLCPRLTSLSITRRTLSHHTIFQLGHHCRQLKHLALYLCGDLPPDTLILLKDCPLESLLISFVNRNDPLNHRIVADLPIFDRLTHLVLWNTSVDLVNSLFPPPPSSSPSASSSLLPAQALPTTTTPNNSTSTSTSTSTSISISISDSIAKSNRAVRSWPHLAKLLLRSCQHLTDATFIPFIQAHPCLQEIDLHDAEFTDASLEVMAEALPQLARLNLAYNRQISGLGMRRFLVHGKCRPHLTLVTLQSCPHVSPKEFPGAASNRDYEIILDQPAIDALAHLD
ncbi:hypothetical protein BCR42DRAFT_456172 [Absidia repens]|uniref:F-box domain-containing protein n=1 Tax=Absidia repens TaxID=90262 RepID=A0A1X2I1M4_9FUNG|nr:hypothetical protein BCR42DRAFT_456172 [Absidia repens]